MKQNFEENRMLFLFFYRIFTSATISYNSRRTQGAPLSLSPAPLSLSPPFSVFPSDVFLLGVAISLGNLRAR